MNADDNEKDTFELSVQKDGVSVGTKGDAASRLGNAVADLASPFAEGLGALGDVIHYYRQDMAIRALQRAKELAVQAGIDVKPVPPKFLVDWVEKASLESPDDLELTNMWAALLLAAGETKSATVYHFKRILSELTKRHVEFLSIICRHDFGAANPYVPENDFSKWIALRDHDYKNRLEIKDLEEDLVRILSDCENNRLFIYGYYLSSFGKFGLDEKKTEKKTKTIVREFEDAFILKYFMDVGIIEKFELAVGVTMEGLDPKLSHHVCVDALHLTKFGIEFISSCQPKRTINETT